MAQATYDSITREIAALQARAEAIRKKEVGEVIRRIKEAIAQYGLTATDLGLAGRRSASSVTGSSRSAGGFADDQGNTWSGRGRRPQWFLDALAAGKAPEELKVGASTQKKKRQAKSKATPTKTRGKKQTGYSDGTNTWSGRGRRPQWFVDALAAGRTAEELSVK